MPIKDNYIFIHVPKCAGTYIEKELGMFQNKKCLFGPDGKGDFLQHMTLKQLTVHSNYKDGDYFTFAFVRNPYTRLISDYRWCKGWFKHKWVIDNSTEIGFKTFNDYIKVLKAHHEIVNAEVHNGNTYKARNVWSHFKPAYEFVYDDKGNLIVDFLGKVENFHEDYSYVLNQLGKPVKENNGTGPKSYRLQDYYTDESFETVNNIFHKDFELFGYVMICK